MLRPARSLAHIALVAAVVALSGCFDSADRGPSATSTASVAGTAAAPHPEHAAEVAESCDYDSRHPSEDEEIKDAFAVANPSDKRHLLLERETVRPGEQFKIALVNDSDSDALYGVETHVRDLEGRTLRPPGPGVYYILIGLIAPPGGVGPCVTVSVPSKTSPGIYEAVLPHVGNRQGRDIVGNFRVAGNRIPDPAWERELRHLPAKPDQ